MKVFSNFDTTLAKCIYQEKIDKFGSEKVMLIRRDHVYLIFRVYAPLL